MSLLRGGIFARIYRKILHKYYANDLWIDLCLAAKKDSINYILENMQDAQVLLDRLALMDFALKRICVDGLILEFGVAKGESIRFIARHTKGVVHGFDSFQGLPLDWRGTRDQRGKFSLKGGMPRVPSNVQLHVGWFDQTLPAFLEKNTAKSALIHIDSDIYESAKIIFEKLASTIVPGTIILFDEYFNYPGWRQHEYKAFKEFILASGLKYKYIGFSAERGQVAVQIESAAT